ncbi:MAG: DMT family transporter [Spirulinaceae cyanobacterium]
MIVGLQRLNYPPSLAFKLSATHLSILALLLAQLAIAIGVFCIKISVQEMGSVSTIFNRCLFAGLIFWLWHQTERSGAEASHHPTDDNLAIETQPKKADPAACPSRQVIGLFLVAGMTWVVCLVLWATSLQYTNLANSTLMHDLSPLFATFLGWAFLKHHFSQRFLLAVGITLVGVVTIGFEDLQISLSHLLGDGLALLSAILLAVYCLLVGQLRSHFSSTTILQWVCLSGSISLIPLLFWGSGVFWPTTMAGWLAIAGVVCFCQVIGQGLTAYSLKAVSSELASLFFPLEAVFVGLLAWVALGEQLSSLNCLGFGLVLGGIYMALLSPAGVEAGE